MTKKAQVQFMEMIFVLLILVVMIFVGFIFYYSFLYKGLEEKGERFTEIDAIILTDSVASMAELTHSTGVINSLKIFSLVNFLETATEENKKYYKDFFGPNKKIILEIVYPGPATDDIDCTIDDAKGTITIKLNNYYKTKTAGKECSKFTIYDSSPTPHTGVEVRSNPVSVYYPLTDEYKIGLLKVEVYKT